MRMGKTPALAAILFALSSPLAAAPINLPASAGKDYVHKSTGIRLPFNLAGLSRQSVQGFAGPETEIAGDYRNSDGSEDLTIYLFRNVSGSVPVWFDKSRGYILSMHDKYPRATSLGIRPFAPRGQRVTSGLMEVFTAQGKSRSTGLMILPVNGFYAKIRFSSAALDSIQLEQQMLAAANAIDWSSRVAAAAAIPVADCPSPLPIRAPAKIAVLNDQDRNMSAYLLAALAKVQAKEDREAGNYCREPGKTQENDGLYRPDGDDDKYLVAIADSGRAVTMSRNFIAAAAARALDKPMRYAVSFVDLEETRNFPEFDTIPTPEQVIKHVGGTDPISVSATWGKNAKAVTIFQNK